MNGVREYTSGLSRAGITLICLWLGIVLYAYMASFSLWLTVFDYSFRPWDMIRWLTLYIFTPWVLLVPVVYVIAMKVPIRPEHWRSSLLKHLALMCLLALMHGYGCALLYYYIGWFTDSMEAYQPWQHTGHFLFMDNYFLVDAFIYACLIGSQNINLNYFRARRHELNHANVQAQLAEARLMALKMQVNPHFLFNTLNAIAVLVQTREVDKATEMINSLSNFFRRTLEQSGETLISLGEELELIRHYLALEQIRFGSRLRVEYRLDESCMDERVPALLLQPLAENAVKHGLAGSEHCELTVSARRVEQGMELEVHNSGEPAADSGQAGLGIGLDNVRNRLETLYHGLQRFEFSQDPVTGTIVRILLPLS